MPKSNVLHPDGSDFDGFLHAYVGADRNGTEITVISTLARLGLDPWREASELAGLSSGAARMRLSAILARFKDIPGLNCENEAVARKLVSLLPDRTAPQSASQIKLHQGAGQAWTIATVTVLAIFLAVLANMLIPGASWLGN